MHRKNRLYPLHFQREKIISGPILNDVRGSPFSSNLRVHRSRFWLLGVSVHRHMYTHARESMYSTWSCTKTEKVGEKTLPRPAASHGQKTKNIIEKLSFQSLCVVSRPEGELLTVDGFGHLGMPCNTREDSSGTPARFPVATASSILPNLHSYRRPRILLRTQAGRTLMTSLPCVMKIYVNCFLFFLSLSLSISSFTFF